MFHLRLQEAWLPYFRKCIALASSGYSMDKGFTVESIDEMSSLLWAGFRSIRYAIHFCRKLYIFNSTNCCHSGF